VRNLKKFEWRISGYLKFGIQTSTLVQQQPTQWPESMRLSVCSLILALVTAMTGFRHRLHKSLPVPHQLNSAAEAAQLSSPLLQTALSKMSRVITLMAVDGQQQYALSQNVPSTSRSS
jgi:hypothetical protein